MNLNEEYQYIVIGAGIAGLHIGALLSQHGKVLILEIDYDKEFRF